MLEGVVPAMAQADDSMGALGDCIHFALDGLQRAAEELAPAEKAGLFTYCGAEAPKNLYEGWDWGWDLAGIAAGTYRNTPAAGAFSSLPWIRWLLVATTKGGEPATIASGRR